MFNSLNFAVFLPIVFFLYWFTSKGSIKIQNIILLVSSYFFYGCWDFRFLFLLIFSTLLDYFSAIKISEAKNIKIKKFWFWLSIIINLGFLAVFKYFNFFIENFVSLTEHFGLGLEPWSINIILPVGISFYTFHGLSYIIDIYKNKIKAEKNFIDYSVFVSFFPLLVAGPIERATHLLPQIQKKRFFDYNKVIDGLTQIIWGLFKKVVIADQCAEYANTIFNNTSDYSGSTLVVGAIFFTFQIYGDFSGYSDIALGTSRLFGIELIKNFSFPYFSRDIAEFWRRWHISLSTWFRDYLYIPLGGSQGNLWIKIRNTFIIFLVSGFWHGANWTFLAWGFLNALYILPSIIFKTNRKNLDIVAKGRLLPNFKEITSVIITFFLIVLAWVFFRAWNIKHAFLFISKIFTGSLFSIPTIFPLYLIILLIIFIIIEWIGRESNYAIEKTNQSLTTFNKWIFYYVIIFLILFFSGSEQNFIYFQF